MTLSLNCQHQMGGVVYGFHLVSSIILAGYISYFLSTKFRRCVACWFFNTFQFFFPHCFTSCSGLFWMHGLDFTWCTRLLWKKWPWLWPHVWLILNFSAIDKKRLEMVTSERIKKCRSLTQRGYAAYSSLKYNQEVLARNGPLDDMLHSISIR